MYLVFGKRSTETVDLERLGAAGFRIDGPRRDAAAGHAVAGVGDVNGDGRRDVVVSAGRTQRSTAYVVFGKASTAPVDLRRLGRHGFAIRGAGEFVDVGDAVSAAGDFNGDGRADVALGAPQSRAASGRAPVHVRRLGGPPATRAAGAWRARDRIEASTSSRIPVSRSPRSATSTATAAATC